MPGPGVRLNKHLEAEGPLLSSIVQACGRRTKPRIGRDAVSERCVSPGKPMSWPCENLGLRTSAHYEDTLPRPGKGSLRSRNKNLAHPAPERIRISGWSGVFTKLEYDPENKTLLFYALVITLRSSSVSFPHFSLILPFISFP